MFEYLKHNNELYRNITIEPNNIPENLLDACEQSSRKEGIWQKILEDLYHPIEVMFKSERERTVYTDLETTENCLDAFQLVWIASNDTSLILNMPNITAEEVVSIALRERRKPVSLLTGKCCESLTKLAHPRNF